MKFYWYWPFAWAADLPWAHSTVREGDEILVQVVDRDGAPPEGTRAGVTVSRTLPNVERDVSGVRWASSRAKTYFSRSLARGSLRRSQRFDLVHYHYVNRFTDSFRAPNRPWVLSVHDVLPHQPRLGGLEVPLHRRLYSLPDALIVHHPWLAERLVADFGVAEDRVFVLPLQIPTVVEPAPLPSNDDPPTVLFFGAIRENKGLDVLAQAVDLLDPSRVRFHIAGRPTAATNRLARSLVESHDNVEADLGFVSAERKDDLFRSASMVVMPYTSFESQSAVLADAYGHGRPVIVTDVGALGHTVRADGTGFVIPALDAEALAAAIDEMTTSDTSHYTLAAIGVASDRSPVNTGRRLRAVYDELL